MKSLATQLIGPLHHAYLLIGPRGIVPAELKQFLNERFGASYASSGNPDYLELVKDNWLIEDSRWLKDWAARRPVKYPVKCAVLAVSAITGEAQNSLLKTLEEPAPDTHFFILADQTGLFLPTVLSRCQIIDLSGAAVPGGANSLAEDFLTADFPIRYKLIKKILAHQEDEARAGSDFLRALTALYRSRIVSVPTTTEVAILSALSEATILAGQRGGSLRLLLEHLAAVVPTA